MKIKQCIKCICLLLIICCFSCISNSSILKGRIDKPPQKVKQASEKVINAITDNGNDKYVKNMIRIGILPDGDNSDILFSTFGWGGDYSLFLYKATLQELDIMDGIIYKKDIPLIRKDIPTYLLLNTLNSGIALNYAMSDFPFSFKNKLSLFMGGLSDAVSTGLTIYGIVNNDHSTHIF